MRLVWVVFALVFVSIVGIQDSFAEELDDFECKEGKELSLDHVIERGVVSSICGDGFSSVLIIIEGEDDGTILIEIPPTVVSFVDRSCTIGTSDYFLLVNGEETPPVEEIIKENTLSLTIPFVKGHNEIEIISAGSGQMLLPNPYTICGLVHDYDDLYLPPAKQIKLGNLLEFIRCNQGLELIFKSNDNSPACVKPETAEKLIQRGWAIP